MKGKLTLHKYKCFESQQSTLYIILLDQWVSQNAQYLINKFVPSRLKKKDKCLNQTLICFSTHHMPSTLWHTEVLPLRNLQYNRGVTTNHRKIDNAKLWDSEVCSSSSSPGLSYVLSYYLNSINHYLKLSCSLIHLSVLCFQENKFPNSRDFNFSGLLFTFGSLTLRTVAGT